MEQGDPVPGRRVVLGGGGVRLQQSSECQRAEQSLVEQHSRTERCCWALDGTCLTTLTIPSTASTTTGTDTRPLGPRRTRRYADPRTGRQSSQVLLPLLQSRALSYLCHVSHIFYHKTLITLKMYVNCNKYDLSSKNLG